MNRYALYNPNPNGLYLLATEEYLTVVINKIKEVSPICQLSATG